MGTLFDLATRLSRTALDAPLRGAARALARYVDIADNLNNCDFDSNGEGNLVRRGAPHWRVALDVGANRGEWSELVSSINPGCQVHAFEPSESTYAMLTARVGGLANVTTHRLGLGDQDAVAQFSDYGPGATGSGFLDRGALAGTAPRHVEVPQARLATVLGTYGIDRVDFAKVDTEGYEMPILKAIPDVLAARRIDCVQFEYGGSWVIGGHNLGAAVALFAAHGYEVFRLMPAGVLPLRYAQDRDENFKYANFVAVHDRAVLARWDVAVLR
jgi:FkbM family methyltransferase